MERKFEIIFITGIAGILGYLLWKFGGVYEIDKIKFTLISLFFSFIFLIYKFLNGKYILIPERKLSLLLFSLMGWIFIKSAFSIYLWKSILSTGVVLGVSSIFFISLNLSNKRILLYLLEGIFIIFICYTFLQIFDIFPNKWWAVKDMVAGRFVNNNHFASFLNLIFFPTFSLFLYHKNKFLKLSWGLYSLAIGYLLIMTKSRGGMVCFILGIIFFSVVIWRKIGKRYILFVFLAVILLGIYSQKGKIYHRFITWKVEKASFYQRLNIWKDSIRIILKHPLGVGFGNFSTIYPVYRTHSDRFLVNYAHNEVIQIGVELGIVGVLLTAILVIYFLKYILEETGYVEAGILSGIFTVSFHSMFDFPLHLPAIFLIFVTFLTFLKFPHEKIFLQRRHLTFSLLVVFLFILLYFPFLKGEILFEKGKKNEKLNWKLALKYYIESIKWNKFKSDFPERAGYIEMVYGLFQGKESFKYKKDAEKFYTMAVQRNPYNSFLWYGLALVNKYLGNSEKAEKYFEKAISLNPTYGTFYIVYGKFLINQKKFSKGAEYIKKGLSLFQEYTDLKSLLEYFWEKNKNIVLLEKMVPESPQNYYIFGCFLYRIGMKEKSEDYFSKAFSLAKNKKEMLKRIINFYTRKGEKIKLKKWKGKIK
ncbi:MAG: hypothetical protein DRP67_05635 [Candidatus Omnitrophota bacterium]|nr:MAG: hypothetical protein DRP67_05635 [Candidatus Omnitrophota bacterium]